MDYSTKAATTTTGAGATTIVDKRTEHRHSNERQTDGASSPLGSDQQDGTYPCPACPIILSSSHELSNHLRGHNSPRSTDYSGEDDYTCGVCHKVLSSASSLDRHVLVHSGERPFKCKYCDMAFTTNGNMNRHLRTAHGGLSPRDNSYTDSEASSDSEKVPKKRRHVEEEYNNNEIAKTSSPDFIEQRDSPRYPAKRKCLDIEEIEIPISEEEIVSEPPRFRIKDTLMEMKKSNNCTVCGRSDFATLALLEAHLAKNHPQIPIKCETCHSSFKNLRVLNLHRHMGHLDKKSKQEEPLEADSVRGFKDLTFLDFTSEKFPTVARAVCEESMHHPASGESANFQCGKCQRAFPCKSALDAHEMECGVENPQARCESLGDDHSKRDDFFARLDLQNKAALTEAKEGKDLADIQSIISVTSGPILQNFPRSDASTPEHQMKINPNVGSSGSSSTPSSEYHQEEEAQDAFAAEFRKMKLKGEFPCRLCTAVFPNLRALKGHNRAHMGVGPGMPYPCNMCPYTSTDKATLVRHLRSHNGDRPFECSLCNYAFTTKANCERHVRNRHGKLTREDIKSVLIYHPSEDYTNDGSLERSSPRGIREDVRKSLVYPNERDEYSHQQAIYSSMSMENRHDLGSVSDDGHVRPPMAMHTPRGISSLGHYERSESLLTTPSHSIVHSLGLNSHRISQHNERACNDLIASSDFSGKLEDDMDSGSSEDGSVSLVSDTKSDVMLHQRLEASPMNLKKNPVAIDATPLNPLDNSASTAGEDAPLDLSMDVLDLSKKSKGDYSSADSVVNSPENIGRSQKELYNATNQFLLTQALLKAGQAGNAAATSLEALYANMMYNNFGGFPAAGVGAGILPPYLFNPHMFGQDFAMKDRLQKELVRGRQLTSGGNLVEPPMGSTAYTGGAYPQARDISGQSISEQPDYSKLMSSKLPSKMVSPRDKLDNSPTTNSVKMVIKNGVLMPKQKQRRYRTERPFTCEHCSARFTLRSNMERHIKQQHPQHWSQRPRGGHSTRGRPPANPPTLLHNANNPGNQSGLSQAYSNILPKAGQSSTGYEKHPISDHVKYAILAQHLKASKAEENDTDEELVIDEGPTNDRETGDNQETMESQRPTSLLRGTLEGSNLYKESSSSRQMIQQQASEASEIEKKKTSNNEENDGNDDDNKGNMADEEAGCSTDDFSPAKVKVETVQQDNEEDSKDCAAPSEMCATENGKDEQCSRDDMSEKNEDGAADLASVSELLDNASQQHQQFQPQYMSDEEGLVASTSDCNNSGSDERSDSITSPNSANSNSSKKKKKKKKKRKKNKSAYSLAPNRVLCPYCERAFPWSSSLRRHILTHTGQKPYKCIFCSLLFTTKSNCDRHLLRKHKNNANKIRRMRNSSSPEAQEQPSNNNSNTFAMRNVPERPYKCDLCPSSTFSTIGNLKKHQSSKHSGGFKSSRPESPVTSEPQNSPMAKNNDQGGYESQSSGASDNIDHPENVEVVEHAEAHPENSETSKNLEKSQVVVKTEGPVECYEIVKEPENVETIKTNQGAPEPVDNAETTETMDAASSAVDNTATENSDNIPTNTSEASKSRRPSPRSSPGPSDVPFKCHLCESGFSERQDCLEHIRINHPRSYETILERRTLGMDIETCEEQQQPPSHYSNRKVVCAFCMRRFWSAEDLRRHMRTHTGDKPFKCDICRRLFTLKHSMLRHRKKHESVDSTMYVGTSGDEESGPSQPPTITPRSQQQLVSLVSGATSGESRIHERISLPTVATVATGDAAPSGLMRFNPYEKLTTLTGKLANAQQHFHSHDGGADTENDLISNLLGIRDKSIIDKVLQASADDAAKLLGVNRNHD